MRNPGKISRLTLSGQTLRHLVDASDPKKEKKEDGCQQQTQPKSGCSSIFETKCQIADTLGGW